MPGTLITGKPPVLTAAQATRALCADADPDLMFGTGGKQQQAARLCRGCPIRLGCLAEALDGHYDAGVWGGLLPEQRRALRRRRPGITDWRALLEREGFSVVARGRGVRGSLLLGQGDTRWHPG